MRRTNAAFLPGLVDALAAEHAAAGVDLVFEMHARTPFLAGEGQFLWDSLAALTLLDPTLVTWQDATVRAVTGRPNAGKVARDPAGRRIRAAMAADGARVEAALLAALRRGGPRAHPFATVGEPGRDVGSDLLRSDAGPRGPRVARGHPGQSE